MAILKAIPGIEANILVNGVALKEYEDPENDCDNGQGGTEETCVRYVEATKDATFQVLVQLTSNFIPRKRDLEVYLYVDGEPVLGLCAKKGNNNIYAHRRFNFRTSITWNDGKAYDHDLVFGEFSITEERSCNSSKALLQRLKKTGTIEIRICDTTLKDIPEHDPRAKLKNHTRLADLTTINEKDLKGSAKSHHVKLGLPRPNPTFRYKCTPVNSERFATFHYKYLSKASLQSLMIIPRSPSPIPVENRPIEQLTMDELRQLVLNGRSLQQKVKNEDEPRGIKRELDFDSSTDGEVQFVSKHPARQQSTSLQNVGDNNLKVIDLT